MAMEGKICVVKGGRGRGRGRASGGAAAVFSFRRCLNLNPSPLRVSFRNDNREQRVRQFTPIALVKRSPKRIKYSTPHFTKKDGFIYVKVDPSGVNSWKLVPVIELLKEGAVGVIPTDTVFIR